MRFVAPFAVAAALMAWMARVPDVGPWTLGGLVPRLGPPTLTALTGAAIGAALTVRAGRLRGAILGGLLAFRNQAAAGLLRDRQGAAIHDDHERIALVLEKAS